MLFRSGGGVSRGVDLEQASGRLALAETNLLTEMTNLHDVRARFQRVVGRLPADDLPDPDLPVGMIPEDRISALYMGYEYSPEINAAIERLRAAQAERKAQNAPMWPRLDLRLRQEIEHDIEGIEGQFDEEAIAAAEAESEEMDRLTASRERIGPVNLVAAEELERIESEHGSNAAEQEELREAVSRLRGSIGKLNREGRERLRAAFEQVNDHFKRLFMRLFEGGEAHQIGRAHV